MKEVTFLSIFGITGGFILSLFGGWDTALMILVLFMTVDYVTGLLIAGVFKTSPKSKGGTLDSRAGFKGLCKKGVTLLIVLVACQLDILLKTDIIRSAAIIAFCANEVISIVENAGLMGIPIPAVIINAIEVLKNKSNDKPVMK